MKNFSNCLVVAVFMLSGLSYADVYVVTAPDKSVYSISEADDAVVPAGYTKDVLKGKDIPSLAIGDDPTLYNFSGKKFTLDDKKVVKKNKEAEDFVMAKESKRKIKASAIAKLKALGLTEEESALIVKRNNE
jgi:hypothetical protein